MPSDKQTTPTDNQKHYFLPGIIAAGLLIIGLTIWSQIRSRISPTPAVSPTIQINLPTMQYPTIPASAPEFTVPLQSLNNSGITGRLTFKDIGGMVAILLYLDGPPGEEEESLMPAELHRGSCSAPGELAYPMTAPDAGQSETDLSINLKEFNTQRPMAVILYRSLQDHTAIACADVP